MKKIFPLLILTLLTLSSCDLVTNSANVLPSTSDTTTPSEVSDVTSDSISSPSNSSDSENPSEPPDEEYRLNPVASNGNIGYVYDRYGEVIKELYQDEHYVELEDVAAYIVTFNDVPDNYFYTTERDGYTKSKRDCYNLYGDVCRIYPGPYNSNYGYLPYSLDDYYHEADIGGEGYAKSSSWNRGALRLVFSLAGIDDYGANAPLVFYTGDHYDTFIEYKNYYGGWGQPFGNNGRDWSIISTWF